MYKYEFTLCIGFVQRRAEIFEFDEKPSEEELEELWEEWANNYINGGWEEVGVPS